MSTKEWISSHSNGASLYQKCLYDYRAHDINPNPATIQVENPTGFSFISGAFEGAHISSQLVVEIPAERFDEFAISWLKKRKLQGALGGPVGNEWGSPDCDYTKEEDSIFSKAVKQRTGQDEGPANLEYDNIFDVVIDDKNEAARLKVQSDSAIKYREVKELKNILKSRTPDSIEKFKDAVENILIHIRNVQKIGDEELLTSVITSALQEAILSVGLANRSMKKTE